MNKKYLIVIILLIAATLRLYGLDRGDTMTDEVMYAFRAVGMLDFDEAADQTTPLEWFDPNIPRWTRLSFHDHPPLVFLIQHIFIKLFGENNFAFRLPSALLGIASVFLIYLLGKLLYSETTGLIASAFLAVTINHTYISRLGLQEIYVVFFALLASYLFLKAQNNDSYFLWTGAAVGLALLTKYTAFVLIPIFLFYLVLFGRRHFFNKKLWIGSFITLMLFTPVIAYNTGLYRSVGHFDFQFSYIFGQDPEVWKIAPGKEIGTLISRIIRFVPTLIKAHSPIFLLIFAISLIAFIAGAVKNLKDTLVKHAFVLISILFFIILILSIGPSYRFLSMPTPFFALAAAVFVNFPLRKPASNKKLCALIVFILIIAYETAYSVNTNILYYPIIQNPFAYAKEIRSENYNWGYNELDAFLKNELKGKRPAVSFEQKYSFIDNIHKRALKRAIEQNLKPYSVIIIYDGNIDGFPQIWVLDRLQIYHAWPVVKTETYLEFLQSNNIPDIKNDKFENFFFIIPTENVYLKDTGKLTNTGAGFERELISRNISPIILKNKRGQNAFRIYKF